MASKTFRLLKAIPGFILGAAAVFDLGATLDNYNYDITPNEADYKAMSADWQETGNDIRAAIEEFKHVK